MSPGRLFLLHSVLPHISPALSHFGVSQVLVWGSSISLFLPPAKEADRYPCPLLGNMLFPLLVTRHQRNSLHAAGVF